MRINFRFDLNINKVVRYFIFADLTFLSGWGLIDPIFAIFVVEKIPGATLTTIGVMAAIYWIVKSIIQVPIALYLDKHDGERDDFYALIIGLLIAALTLFSFMAAREVWHLYTIQLVKAVAFALYVPAWSATLARHLDKQQMAFELAIASTAAGGMIGLTGLLGSWLANFSYNFLFLFGGFLALASALILLWVPDLILPGGRGAVSKPFLRDHGPANIQK
ncbi:MAG TPA: MFS transporter [Candidatus Paceibacterota bacterium]